MFRRTLFSAVTVMSDLIGRGSLIEGSTGVVGSRMADRGRVVVRGDERCGRRAW